MGDEYGDCIVMRVSTPAGDTAIVERADPAILIAAELVDDWMRGESNLTVRLDEGGIFTLGTPGAGLGRVSYQLGERHDMHTFVARRIEVGRE